MLRTVEFGGWKGCFLGLCNGVNDQNRDGDGALLRNCNQGYDNVMFHAKVSHISTSMLESDPIWLVQSDPPSHFWKSKTIKMIFSFRNCWFKSLLKQQSTWGKNIQSPWVHLEFQNHDSFLFFLFNQPTRISRAPKFLGFLNQQVLDLLRSYMWFKNWRGSTTWKSMWHVLGPDQRSRWVLKNRTVLEVPRVVRKSPGTQVVITDSHGFHRGWSSTQIPSEFYIPMILIRSVFLLLGIQVVVLADEIIPNWYRDHNKPL